MKERVKILIEKIKGAKSIALIMHNNPDGDALGSTLGLAELIHDNFGKSAACLYVGTIPRSFDWMPGRGHVQHSAEIAEDYAPDLAIMIDTSGGNTGTESMAIFGRAHDTIKIDHHPEECSPDLAKLNIHKIVNSTAQIILEIAQTADWKISRDVATNLYAAISDDTGRFKWVDTPDAFVAAAECVKLGADPREVDEQMEISDRESTLLNAKIVIDAEFYFDGKLAMSSVVREDYPKLDGKGGNAMEALRMIDSVEYVALLKETAENNVHVSFRSRRLPVHLIAAALGGGGHPNAAAARIYTNLDDAKKIILQAFENVV